MRALATRIAHAIGWAIVILATAGVTWAVSAESWSDHWGATADEVGAVLPGDDLIHSPASVTTRAVTVRVPPARVWPWVAQFGQGRGGLYSYDWLERAFGIDMTSATEIQPGLQQVAVGDQLWVTQPGYPADLGLVVADVTPGESLVLAASTPSRPSAPEESPWTWTFVVQPGADDTTRLIVRNRNATIGAAGDMIWDRIVGPIGFAMERKTMLTIAQRAEDDAGLPTAASWREPLWFAALLLTALAIVAITLTTTPEPSKALTVVVLTAAATVVLFRVPSLALGGVLATGGVLLASVMWEAYPPRSLRPRQRPSGRSRLRVPATA